MDYLQALSWIWSSIRFLAINLHLQEVCLLLFLIYVVYDYQIERKKAFPSWPLLRGLPHILLNYNNLLDWSTETLLRCGGTYFGKGPALISSTKIVLTCDPRNINYILKTNFHNYPRGESYHDIMDMFGEGILNSDGDSWNRQRRIANTHMQSRNFKTFLAKTTVELIRSRLFPILQGFASSASTFDLQDVFLRYTFDSICTMVLGTNLNCLSEGFPQFPFNQAVDTLAEIIVFRHVIPPKCWHFMRMFRLGKERKAAEALKVVNEFIAQVISQRREALLKNNDGTTGKLEGDDLLSTYMRQFPDDDLFLRDNVFSILAAGRDTTGISLSWLIWLVTKNPSVEAKILEELQGILNEKKRDFIEVEDLKDMVYLHAAIYESLRLYPPIPVDHRGIKQQDTLPDGNVVRPDMKIIYLIYAVGRMESVWGEDCREFKPERWMDEEGRPKIHDSTNNLRFLAFNAGPRSCIGKEMAIMQMKFIASELLLNFEIKVVEGHCVSPKPSLVLTMKNGLAVQVKERPCRSRSC